MTENQGTRNKEKMRRFCSKEYSQSVKSKNALAGRTGEQYLKRAVTDLNNFHSRYSGEVFRLQGLRKSIDSKLMDFNPSEFKKTVGQLKHDTPKPDQTDKSDDMTTRGRNMQKRQVLANQYSLPVIKRSKSALPNSSSRTVSSSAVLYLKKGVTPRPKTAICGTPRSIQYRYFTENEDNDIKENLKQSRSFRSIKNSLKLQEAHPPSMKELRLRHYIDRELYHNELLDKKVQMLCLQMNTMRSRDHVGSNVGLGEPTALY